MDAPLALQRIAHAAVAATPNLDRLLDVGCGAGNFTLRLLQLRAVKEITLVDLSRLMLDRAEQRIRAAQACTIHTLQGDIRELSLGEESYDVILAGAVLHHLRTDIEWQTTIAKFYDSLAPGGSLWIFDLVTHPNPSVQAWMWSQYGEYLESLRDRAYRDQVFAYIEKEDTPRTLIDQLNLLQEVGFSQVDVLHYNTCFAAFGGVK
jgi:tRNA (cmo5U34)-methyltransferase